MKELFVLAIVQRIDQSLQRSVLNEVCDDMGVVDDLNEYITMKHNTSLEYTIYA